MEGEGLAGSLSPALFAPRLTRACKMRKSKENPGWAGMIGGLSPFPRRDGRALREGWSLKSRRLQGDLRLIILWCKSWLMSNQGLGRRGGKGGIAGHSRGEGASPAAQEGSSEQIWEVRGRIPSPLSSGTWQRIPGSFPCFTRPLPPRLAASPLLSNHASYQEPIYLIIWDLDLFHVFVVPDNTSHPADSIDLSGMVWTGAGNTPIPNRPRTSWIMVKLGGEGGSSASLLAGDSCPVSGSHSQRCPGRFRILEQEDPVWGCSSEGVGCSPVRNLPAPVPSGLCLPFPTERGTNISR